jgi:hypothetical protein
MTYDELRKEWNRIFIQLNKGKITIEQFHAKHKKAYNLYMEIK